MNTKNKFLIDFINWYREDDMTNYTPEHLSEWFLKLRDKELIRLYSLTKNNTVAEKKVIDYLYSLRKSNYVLLVDYGLPEERLCGEIRWVEVNCKTNKASYFFLVLAEELEQDNFNELIEKIR